VKLVMGLFDSVPIVGVHHEDEPLRVLVVVLPQPSDLVLAADIPYREVHVLVLEGLDVEAEWYFISTGTILHVVALERLDVEAGVGIFFTRASRR
jgi:hypothetical protein